MIATMESLPLRERVALALTITRREVSDTLRDWRIVVPIVFLTLVFPVIMNFTADVALDFVARYGAPIVGERLIPFLLMIVGFFPISFSLVIALETFVGEKERRSLEPLLATPLSNLQLYAGKILAAMVPPLLASYLGMSVYLIALYLTVGWTASPALLTQIFLLTTAEALVMVSGAVVVSSQTTSVRAANLLASFIIIPMAFLVQGESLIMFWGRYEVLWWILAGLLVVDLILIRMGARIFNREELLGREIDSLDLRRGWQSFRRFLLQPDGIEGALTLRRLLRWDLPLVLGRSRLALVAVLVAVLGGVGLGWSYALRYPLPNGVLVLKGAPMESFQEMQLAFLPPFTIWGIFNHNVRALLLEIVLGLFSFGALAVVLLLVPMAMIGFFMAQVSFAGYNPLLFLATFVLPHGLFELPAAIVTTALVLRLGASMVSPPEGMTLREAWLLALADLVKLFLLVVLPLLLIAAFVEVQITPRIVLWVYGG